MAADPVAEIKARIDIVEVVGSQVALRRAGREHVGLCPFHGEKTPSFTVSREKQVWFCHGCGQGGDVFAFVMRMEHADFRQALETLADRAGIELQRAPGRPRGGQGRRRALDLQARAQSFFEHVLWSTPAGTAGRQLLAERGVEDSVARRFGIGFAPAGGAGEDALVRYLTSRAGASPQEVVDAGLAHPSRGGRARDRFRHRLVFPIRDERGQAIAFGARALGEAVPKYLNSPETAIYSKSRALFGLDLARDALAASRSALVVEGYFDVIAAHSAGLSTAVASSGTALTREQARVLHRYADTIVLCFDSDSAGQAAASRAVDVIAAEGCDARVCLLPPGAKDPDELARRDPNALVAAVAAARPEWQVLLDGALEGGEGGTVEARRAALERCVSVLVRIPVAAVRELYLQEAARRLDVPPAALAADLGRALHEPRRHPAPLVVPPLHQVEAAEATPADAIPVPAAPELLIGGLAVQRPDLAHALVDAFRMRLEEIGHPQVRRLVEVALETPAGSPFPLHRLAPAEQRLAAQLLIRALPELEEAAPPHQLERALADGVRGLREAAVQRRIEVARGRLHRAQSEGHDAEAEEVAAQITALAAESQRLRHPAG